MKIPSLLRGRHLPRLSSAAPLALALVALVLGSGCSTLERVRLRNPVPPRFERYVEMPGLPGVRAWGDDPASLMTLVTNRQWRSEASAGTEGINDAPDKFVDILAISGGGGDGAYGAGLLCGWTISGTRPKFHLVTGISTGALMAPLAFLGTNYDDVLEECYTKISSKDIFKINSLIRILFGESLADTTPLQKLVKRHFSEELIAAVGEEHRRGRRLYVATSNLDAQRPVIWDMGAIACHAVQYFTNEISGQRVITKKFDDNAVLLFRRVLIASASIPVAFQPQYFKVNVNGRTFDEMHVDGGAINQVFIAGVPLDAAKLLGQEKTLRVFVIRNGKVAPDHRTVYPLLKDIAVRAIASLTKSQGLGAVQRIYQVTQEQNAEFHFACIPDEIKVDREDEFDPNIMRRLFDVGFIQAKSQYPWMREPPGLAASRLFPSGTPKSGSPRGNVSP